MKTYDHKLLSIEKLKPYEKNSRTHSTDQIKQIMDSIKAFGFTNPLLIDDDFNLIAGHGRLEAVKQLNKVDFAENPILEIPCIVVSGLSEMEQKALVIADNKIALNAGWDIEVLGQELFELENANFDMSLTGFNAEELVELLGEFEDISAKEFEGSGEEEAIEPPKEAKIIKRGDLIELGRHRVLCGDSTIKEDVDKLMRGDKADMVLTDPPYGMDLNCDFSGMTKGKPHKMTSKQKKGEIHKDVKGDREDFTPTLITTIFENFGYCKEIFLWGADYFAEHLLNKNDGSFLVWDKRHGIEDVKWSTSEFELCWSKNRHLRRVLRFQWFGLVGCEETTRFHPTQKPILLLQEIIKEWGGGFKKCD